MLLRRHLHPAQPRALAILMWRFRRPEMPPEGRRWRCVNLARSEGRLKSITRGCGDAVGVRRPLIPSLKETPDSTKILTIGATLCSWNVLADHDACCMMHWCLNEMQRILDKLQAKKCNPSIHLKGRVAQCPKCQALNTIGSSENTVGQLQCDLCGHVGGEWGVAEVPVQRGRGRAPAEVMLEEAQDENYDNGVANASVTGCATPASAAQLQSLVAL